MSGRGEGLPLPEQLVQRLVQQLADGDAQPDGGVVVPLFNGVDGLPGDPHRIRQRLLGQVLCRPGGFQLQVFHSSSSANSAALRRL